MRVFVSCVGSVIALLSAMPSKAEELGNVFGSEEVMSESRAASAAALGALSRVIEALRLKELRESSGVEELQIASQELREASQRMNGLIGDSFPNFEFSVEDSQLIESRASNIFLKLEEIGFERPASFLELFQLFVALGEELANDIELAIRSDGSRSYLSFFADKLADYLILGDLVTELSRSRLQ